MDHIKKNLKKKKKDTIKKTQRQATEWDKVLTQISDKPIIQRKQFYL